MKKNIMKKRTIKDFIALYNSEEEENLDVKETTIVG